MDWMLLPLKRYADFSGRSRRKEYWMFVLFNTLVFLVLGIFAYMAISSSVESAAESTSDFDPALIAVIAVCAIYALATFIPNLAVQVRRFHDQDRSGWFVLLNLIPYLGGLIILIFMVLDGTPGTNRYGADPKGRAA